MFGEFLANSGLYALDPYGSLSLTESSPPQSFVEPLTVAEMKAYLKLPATRSPVDPAEDQEIADFISAARIEAEVLQGRDLVRKQWDLSLDYWLESIIRLRAPLVSVDLIQVKDSTGAVSALVENTDYITDLAKSPGLLAPPYNSTWRNFTPWPSSAILIRYTSGMSGSSVWWQADGMTVKAGMRRLISDWYNNKLPFEKTREPATEIPFGVTAALSQGAVRIIR
jgi:uncharacterized phiE125 gp8 family phage protein